MHSPLIFAYTPNGAGVPDLKAAASRQAAIDSFVGCGVDDETLFERLEKVTLADWVYELKDVEGWDVVDLLKGLGDGVTFTPVNEFYGFLEVSEQQCRELLSGALEATVRWFQVSHGLLASGSERVSVTYPSLSSDVTAAVRKEVQDVEQLVRDYGFSGHNFFTGKMFVVVDEYSEMAVYTFGQLVRNAVRAGEGLRLAVAHCFTGGYHW